jgi:hypothetical protein
MAPRLNGTESINKLPQKRALRVDAIEKNEKGNLILA